MPRVLCGHGGKKEKGDRAVYQEPARRGLRIEANQHQGIGRTRIRVARTSRQKRQPHVSGCLRGEGGVKRLVPLLGVKPGIAPSRGLSKPPVFDIVEKIPRTT